jgi:hypothetical protein
VTARNMGILLLFLLAVGVVVLTVLANEWRAYKREQRRQGEGQ